MLLDLGQCPVCQGPLSYSAKSCPRCGHPFDKYGDFGGYLVAMEEERQEKEAEAARIRRQRFSRSFTYSIIILLALVVIVLLWYLIQHVSLGSVSAASGNPIIPMPSPTPSTSSTSLAETTIQQYYDDVNSQNYQSAYMMWDSQKESLADFQKGYSHTKSDTLIFGDVVPQADGTTKVFVTVVATEITSSGGTIQHTYKGYYIVGQRGNTWKILYGTLNLAL